MNENEYRPVDPPDEDLSPSFTRERPRPVRQMPNHRAPADTQGAPARPSEEGGISHPPVPAEPPIPRRERYAPPPAPVRPKEEEQASWQNTPLDEPEEEENTPARTSRIPRLHFGRLALLVLVILLILGAVGFGAKALLTVRSVTVSSEADLLRAWTEEELLRAAGIPAGVAMWKVDAAAVSDRVAESIASLDGVKVVKSFPGKIVLIPLQAAPSYRFTYENTTYILSAELKVLMPADSSTTHLPELILGRVSTCEVGKFVTFEGEYDYETVLEVTSELRDLLSDMTVNSINMENKFSISVLCESKYKLLFGDKKQLEQKVKLARGILDSPGFNPEAAAVIDVSSGNKAVVKFTEFGN